MNANSEPDRLDPRQAEHLLTQTERSAEAALTPDTKAMYLVWTVAWLTAMIAAYFGVRPDGPYSETVGMTIYGIAIGVGLAFSIYQNSKTRGLGGRTRDFGKRWGISWAAAWGSYVLILAGLNHVMSDGSGARNVMETLAPVLATFVIGALYLQGGAFWPESKMMVPGWLLLIVAGAATMFGPVDHYLVLGIGGALSFLVGAWRTPSPGTRSNYSDRADLQVIS